MHVHFRDPGFEYKETIESGARAAVHGGFTDVATMPNTDPVTDNGAEVRYQIDRARHAGFCHVRPIGALTVGEKGQTLAEIGDMVMEGAVAFSDDGHGVQSAGMMRTCMEYVSQFDKVVSAHCEIESLTTHGVINEGRATTRLGMFGWPALGEELEIYRDIELCRMTGCSPPHRPHLHREGPRARARRQGRGPARHLRGHPAPPVPLRGRHHRRLRHQPQDEPAAAHAPPTPPPSARGILDGSIDCVVTDHAPHAPHEKDCEWEIAFFGIVGLETSLPLMLTNLVLPGKMSWSRLVEVMAVNPRRCLRLPEIRVEEGSTADLTLIDPTAEVTVTEDWLQSRSKNSAWLGQTLTGCASDVFVAGRRTLTDGELTPVRRGFR